MYRTAHYCCDRRAAIAIEAVLGGDSGRPDGPDALGAPRVAQALRRRGEVPGTRWLSGENVPSFELSAGAGGSDYLCGAALAASPLSSTHGATFGAGSLRHDGRPTRVE